MKKLVFFIFVKSLGRTYFKQKPCFYMLSNHSEKDEKLQRILDTVQTLQERPPVDPNTSLEEKYQKLLEEHNRIIVAQETTR